MNITLRLTFGAVPLKKLHVILHFAPAEKVVPRISRSVHAWFTVIDGLLPVIEGLLGVASRSVHARFTLGSRSVHARFTLALLGP